jgi:SAM-dependent methyltransferase
MQESQRLLWNLYGGFWSLYGRFVWDDQREPARVSEPPERVVDILLERRIGPDECVLDAGCGTGNYALALAREGFCVTGVDFAPGMLARAREKADGDVSGRVSFQQADLNSPLKFPDGHFDHVISISVLQAVADPAFTLKELYRVLKPRGILLLSLPRRDSPIKSWPIGKTIHHRLCHLEGRTLGKMLLVVLKTLGDRYHPIPMWTELDARGMLGALGFETVAVAEGRQLVVVAAKVWPARFELSFC